jgi:hypothetical protein
MDQKDLVFLKQQQSVRRLRRVVCVAQSLRDTREPIASKAS